jgi:hypothetical protein
LDVTNVTDLPAWILDCGRMNLSYVIQFHAASVLNQFSIQTNDDISI